NTVPAEDAAITSRTSLALGSFAAGTATVLAIDPSRFPASRKARRLASCFRLGKRCERCLPWQQHGSVARRVIPRGCDHMKIGPVGHVAQAGEPCLHCRQRGGDVFTAASGSGSSENRRA